MAGTDPLRALLASAAQAAPSDLGLLGAVLERSRRDRRRRVTAVVVAAALVVGFILTAPALLHTSAAPPPVGSTRTDVPSPSPAVVGPHLDLVPFHPPSFPYVPHWTAGSYTIKYAAGGLAILGAAHATGLDFTADSGGGASLILSTDPPHPGGTANPATVDGRPATVYTHILATYYKDDAKTEGTAICWQPVAGGDWLTIAGGPDDTPANLLSEAAHLSAIAVPVATTLAPAVAPAGMHLIRSDASQTVLGPDDPAIRVVIEVLGQGTADLTFGLDQAHAPGLTTFTYEVSSDVAIRILVTGAVTFDLPTFAADIGVHPDGVGLPQ